MDIDYRIYVKKYFIFIFICIICIFLSILSILYITDPLQLFHKSFFHKDKMYYSMREQAAGIINSFEFDSVILGTSMLENTSAREASQKIGGIFVNISLAGSSFYERAIVLKKVLQKNISHVIYSLDSVYLGCIKENPSRPTKNWAFLYDDNPLNDYKFYLTKEFIKNIFSPAANLQKINMDRPNAWFSDPFHAVRFGGLAQWVQHIENPQVNNFLLHELPALAKKSHKNQEQPEGYIREKESALRDYLDSYLIDIIAQHPKTKFYLIFPPYYRFTYANMAQNAPYNFHLHQYAVRYLVSKTHPMKNVHVYGFEDQQFLDDIANYKDTTHFHHRFNSYFLDAIASNTHILTVHNLEQYLASCKNLALEFNISQLNDEVQSLLRKQKEDALQTSKSAMELTAAYADGQSTD